MANSVDPDQTAPIGAVCSGSTLFACLLKFPIICSGRLQQTTFSDAFFFALKGSINIEDPDEKASEYDQELPQSQITD